jgi:hypothetical protein
LSCCGTAAAAAALQGSCQVLSQLAISSAVKLASAKQPSPTHQSRVGSHPAFLELTPSTLLCPAPSGTYPPYTRHAWVTWRPILVLRVKGHRRQSTHQLLPRKLQTTHSESVLLFTFLKHRTFTGPQFRPLLCRLCGLVGL